MQIWSYQPRKEVHPMNSKMQSEERGMREIFCRYIWRYGKRIYPKNAKFFHFFVKA